MNAVDVFRHEMSHAYAWLETNVSDITPEQAAWSPLGTANSIAATYAHIVVNADVDLTRYFHGRLPLIEEKGWIAQLGLNETFLDDWETYLAIDWELLHEYGREVQKHVQQLAGALTQADLD